MITGGPAAGLDPAYAYDTLSLGVIDNVYEPVLTYNGTSTTSYSPVLTTCIPGGTGYSGCAAEYHSIAPTFTGVYNQLGVPFTGSNGNPTYWTIPVDPNAQFYSPATGNHWGVYPTDLMFSQERNLAFANLPYSEATAGWIMAQALLPIGDPNFDGGIHFPFDNTPGNILSSMLINDSSFCPTAIQAVTHGCITYNASGSGTFWPNFLDFLVIEGGYVEPCSWFTAAGAAAPGFSGASVSGDFCSLPYVGGSNPTTQSNGPWYSELTTLNGTPTAWDSYEELAISGYPTHDPQGHVNKWAVGSGPYALVGGNMTLSEGYDLVANPYYVAPSGCAGHAGTGCWPATDFGTCLGGHLVGTYDWSSASSCAYIPFVDVTYVAGSPTTDAATSAAFQSGQQDFGGFTPTDAYLITNGVSAGYLKYETLPTIDNFFIDYDLAWNTTSWGEFSLGPSPNVGTNFLDNIALRNFLSYTFPYGTAFGTLYKTSGITTQFPAGGPLPLGMGCYYPTSYDPFFPGAPNPVTTNAGCTPTGVGTASNPSQYGYNPLVPSQHGSSATPYPNGWYYWLQAMKGTAISTTNYALPAMTDYDANYTVCTTHSPCTIVLIGENGATALNSAEQAWASAISGDSGGTIKATFISVSFTTLLELPYGPADPQLVSNLGWAPDYPLPLDYLNPEEAPSGLFTAGLDNVPAVLDSYNTTGVSGLCTHIASNFADLAYWSVRAIPQSCQGSIYQMAWNESVAASLVTDLSLQTTYYHQASAIYNNLSLYSWQGQANQIVTTAPWISFSSIIDNPMYGGSGDLLWFQVGYQATTEVNFIATGGLPSPAKWVVGAPGYALNTSGPYTGANAEVVGFTSNGAGCAIADPTGTCMTLQLPQGSDAYTAEVSVQGTHWFAYVSSTIGGHPAKSPLTVSTSEINVTLAFGAVGNISFTESGLATSIYNSNGWGISMTAAGLPTFSGSVSGPSMTAHHGGLDFVNSTNGLAPVAYTYTLTYPSGYAICTKVTTPGCGAFLTGDLVKATGSVTVVAGVTTAKTFVFYATLVSITFKESGLTPAGTLWGVFLNSSGNPGPTTFSLIPGTSYQALTGGTYTYLSSSNATLEEYNYTTVTVGANATVPHTSPSENAAINASLYANDTLACTMIGATMSGTNGASLAGQDTLCSIVGTWFVQYSSSTTVVFTGIPSGTTLYSYYISLPPGFVGSPTSGFTYPGTKGVTVAVTVVDPHNHHVVLYAPEAATRTAPREDA